jgi:hypothetical protein
LAAAAKFPRFFLSRFLTPLVTKRPKTRQTKYKIEQNNRGRKKKTEEKKAVFLVMSPDGLFLKVLTRF